MAIMNNKIFFALILLIVVSLWSCSLVSSQLFNKVYIENSLGPNNTLTVHCKSKDNDLGEHNIDFHQSYNWSFKNSFGTLFWCRIWWYDHHHLVWLNNDMFDVRLASRDCVDDGIDKYMHCIRRAQWDGIYFSHWNGSFTKMYDWIRE
ncbi:hypothetical protein AQUCO_07800013v1 [Aquilegia coerulea]|uniref:S-protein homolog n=1 Tax=Aquilegia coerulea TaxID=218851 RepID=A0A2G5C7W8_AQUCA|nr:hypothetical protein AQUCO_07800013v1 [Aquilegia coerulea]